jgi:hypothetical protein
MSQETAVRNVVIGAGAPLPLRIFRRVSGALTIVLVVWAVLRLCDIDIFGGAFGLLDVSVSVPAWASWPILLLTFCFLFGRVWQRRAHRLQQTQADAQRIRALGLFLPAVSSRNRAARAN